MKLFYCLFTKRCFRVLIVCIALLVSRFAANAQCYAYSLNAIQIAPSYVITSPQWITLKATMDNEFADRQNFSWGRIYWYYQETGGQPFAMQEVATNQNSFSSTIDVYADYNVTLYYCYYDYFTNCETERKQYDFGFYSLPPAPYIYWEYGYVCGNVARLKVTSNQVVTLYKQSALGGNNYDYITSSGSGYFEIADYNPNTTYYVGASNGIQSVLYGTSFDYYSTNPLGVSGNLSILTGSSTTLNVSTGDNFNNFYWYDAAGNFLTSNWSYTTPVLTANTTYQVRGYNEAPDGTTCVTDPKFVTVQVTTPPPPVTCDDRQIYIQQSSPANILCSPQWVTLTAEMYNDTQGHDGLAWGKMKWYTQQTGGEPFYEKEFGTNQPYFSSSTEVYANSGVAIYVSYLDLWTGCESPRISYEFTIYPTPYLNFEYAYVCGNVAKIKMNSNGTVTLYKQSASGGNNYDYITSSGSGYIEIADYDPHINYFVGSANICYSAFYGVSFDVFPITPPPVTGNTAVLSGSSTTLTANGDVYGFKWYDGNGNFLQDGYSFTTPVLSDNVFTYQVRAVTDGNVCISEPAIVTITANRPTTVYSPLYNSANFTKTVDLSKPVGTVKGAPGTTSTGAVTYTIPIVMPPGTNGSSPTVNIGYNSQAANGTVGYGWNIAGLSAVGRQGHDLFHYDKVTPVTFTDQDAFMLDGSWLNPVSGNNGGNGTVYALDAENFSKIISNGGTTSNPDWFQVIAKDGSIMEYGHSTDSRILTDDGANVTLWRLNKIIDVNGNYTEFKYTNAYRDSRIDEINYTGNAAASLLPYNKIKFNYEVRTDIATTYVTGASFTTKHILKNIVITSEGNKVKTYEFNYGFDNLYSLLKEVTEKGSDDVGLNSTIFLYGNTPQGMEIQHIETALSGQYDFFAGDFNADGRTDLMAASVFFANGKKYHQDYDIRTDISTNSSGILYIKQLASSTDIYNSRNRFSNFLTNDYDGDGRDDAIEVGVSGGVGNLSGYSILTNIKINLTRNHNGNTGSTDYVTKTYDYTTPSTAFTIIEPTNGNFLIPGDFDGDGNQDFITILGAAPFNNPANMVYQAFFNRDRKSVV